MKSRILFALAMAAALAAGIFAGRSLTAVGIPSAMLEQVEQTEGNIGYLCFRDAEGRITLASDRGYASRSRQYSEDGRVMLERYYDAGGDPIRLKSGYYGIRREYDTAGNVTRLVYLDAAGEPVNSTAGYAEYVTSFYADGQVNTRRYFDASGKPAKDGTGAYGFQKLYDEAGQNIATIYLDAEGDIGRTNMGYAVVRRTFYQSGKTHRERFFDAQSLPTTGSTGEYGVEYSYDAAGHIVMRVYLGPDGGEMVLPRGFSRMVTTYDANGVKIKDAYFGPGGQSARVLGRYHAVIYDGSRKTYADESGRRVFLLDEYLKKNHFVVILMAVLLCAAAIWLPPRGRWVLTGLYLLFIVYMTLMYREIGDSKARMELFWSYRQIFDNRGLRQEVLNNIFLFVPFGALLRSVTKKKWVLILPLVLTVSIELTQYVTGLGLCETDDIFGNTLGGLLGYWAVHQACLCLSEERIREILNDLIFRGKQLFRKPDLS